MFFAHFFKNYLSQCYHIFNFRRSWCEHFISWFEFTLLKVKVTSVFGKNVRNCFRPLSLEIFIYHRAFIFYILIGVGEGLSPIAFMSFSSKDKVTLFTFVKRGICLLYFYYTACICKMLLGFSEDKTHIDFGLIRLKVKVTFFILLSLNNRFLKQIMHT